MPVPEAAMHEDDLATRPEHQVGTSGKPGGVKPIAIAKGMYKPRTRLIANTLMAMVQVRPALSLKVRINSSGTFTWRRESGSTWLQLDS
jgi:hypothetical protein